MAFLKFTCNVESLERKSESMDLPMHSDKLRNMHCLSSLTVYYFYDSGRKTISFSIQESEIFPKTFLGLICSHPLRGDMFLNATWSEAEELLAAGWSSFWKFIWVYGETVQVHGKEIHAELSNTSEEPLPLNIWGSGCWWEKYFWSVVVPCVLILPYISAVGHWRRQFTTVPSTGFPPLEPVREPQGLSVKLGQVSWCVQPACTGHYAKKYFKSCIALSGHRFKFSLGSRQMWTDYLQVSYKIQLPLINWFITYLRKIE